MSDGVTPCHVYLNGAVCPFDGHVVLFANPNGPVKAARFEFAGVSMRPGETVVYCLKHGGHIYDALRGDPTPQWLAPYGPDELPVVSLEWHHRRYRTVTPRPTNRVKYGGDLGPKPRSVPARTRT